MVLIVSCYIQNNYGSKLQAYATQEFLDKHCIENMTVNYSEIKKTVEKKKIEYYIRNIAEADVFYAQLKKYILKFRALCDRTLGENMTKRKNAFETFSTQMFRLTNAYSFDDLFRLINDIRPDAVVVGSDQLWLPSNIYADYYTLRFVPDEIKKISYATSFGVDHLNKNVRQKAKNFLERIDNISVRERSGEKIIAELICRKAEIVCDPTLLFSADEWTDKLQLKKQIGHEYIFCYFIGNDPKHREWARKLSELTGLKTVALPHVEEYVKIDDFYADTLLYDVSPQQFVSLIAYSSFVCTDSFHGTVFSLLYHKQFFSFRRFKSNYAASTNSRLDSLLEPLKLKGRIISDNTRPCDVINDVIDYDFVDNEIKAFRKRSADWFLNSLGEKIYDPDTR